MDNCPKCKTSWIGDPIPEDISTHWRREIGIDGEMLGIYDGIVAIKCPDCQNLFPKDDSELAKTMFYEYLLAISEIEKHETSKV